MNKLPQCFSKYTFQTCVNHVTQKKDGGVSKKKETTIKKKPHKNPIKKPK